jgi:two-component system catabolic regulation response regulator CreB
MSKPDVTLIEDEPSIADTVIYALESEGYAVRWKQSGREAIEQVRARSPQIVILDIGLPDLNGFEVFREIRAFSQVPVIFLTARAEEIDRVTGLEMGADDYIVKPFSPRELTARVRAVLRRVQAGSDTVDVDVGPFVIDEPSWTIRFHGQALDLTRHEFQILGILLKSPGQIFSRDQLLDRVWDAPEHRLDRTVDTHIKNIRAKLRAIDADADPIKTKRGVGYFASWSN